MENTIENAERYLKKHTFRDVGDFNRDDVKSLMRGYAEQFIKHSPAKSHTRELPDTCIHEGTGMKFCFEVNKCKKCSNQQDAKSPIPHTVTDHDLSEIADNWADNINLVNTGLRTAFAAGYRTAEKKANERKSPIPQGGETVCDKCNKPALYHLCGEHLIQTFEHERK